VKTPFDLAAENGHLGICYFMYKIIENKFSEEEEKMMKYGEPLIHNIKNKLWHIPLRKVI
jgi:hypothetical protein